MVCAYDCFCEVADLEDLVSSKWSKPPLAYTMYASRAILIDLSRLLCRSLTVVGEPFSLNEWGEHGIDVRMVACDDTTPLQSVMTPKTKQQASLINTTRCTSRSLNLG